MLYFNDDLIGKITDISRDKNPLIIIDKKRYVPYNKNFIDTVLISEGRIILKNCEGLLWK